MNKNSIINLIFGIVLILLGIFLLFLPGFENNMWVFLIWFPGIIMEYYGLKETKGLLVPGGILLIVSLALTMEVIIPGFLESGGWTLFILAPSIGLLQLLLTNKNKLRGLLIPISILFVVFFAFVLQSIYPGFLSSGGWTMFIFAPAIGLFLLYLFQKPKNTSLLIPVLILTFFGLVFLLSSIRIFQFSVILGLALIVFGCFILFSKLLKRRR
ncbi:MAG: hypothetical protein FXF54_05125 [Kosmotoga sp.]|nr:MAG: hypothetical protein FXF54_05125 [Kosmotoga sp.]